MYNVLCNYSVQVFYLGKVGISLDSLLGHCFVTNSWSQNNDQAKFIMLLHTLQFTIVLEPLAVNQIITEYKRSVDDTYKELENYAS